MSGRFSSITRAAGRKFLSASMAERPVRAMIES